MLIQIPRRKARELAHAAYPDSSDSSLEHATSRVGKKLRTQDRVHCDIFEVSVSDDMLPLNALGLHPELFHDAARGWVSGHVTRLDSVEAEFSKPEFEHRLCSFRGETAVPKWEADPIPEFTTGMNGVDMEADRPHESVGVRCDREGEDPTSVPFRTMCRDPSLRHPVLIGVRDILRRQGDFSDTREDLDTRSIYDLEGTKRQVEGL
jgi:hypothetical protein